MLRAIGTGEKATYDELQLIATRSIGVEVFMSVTPRSDAHRIVIVGGGAGGLELASKLGKRFRKRDDVDVVLVDKSLTHIWKPLLHEVASGTLNSHHDELSYLAQANWKDFRFKLGALESIDRVNKTVSISESRGPDGEPFIPARTLRYDTLVIAIGSVTNDFRIPGVAEHCAFLDSRAQADRFHQQILRSLYSANAQQGPLRPGQLHVAIAGAGATGVELCAELHTSFHTMVQFGLDRIDPERDFRIHLIEGADRILPGLPPKISASTQRVLERIGVEVHLGEFVSEASSEGFMTKSGHFIPAEIKVWAAGIKGPDVLGELDGLEANGVNQLVVKRTLQTTRDPDIYALGDCAACTIDDQGTLVPPRAQAAHQQATLIYKSILARMAGKETLPEYEYNDYGSLVNLSTHSTVGSLMGNLLSSKKSAMRIEGFAARLAYRSLYKMHQLATLGPVRTALMTIADLVTQRSKPRLKLH